MSRGENWRTGRSRQPAQPPGRVIREQEEFGDLVAQWRRKISRAPNIPETTKRILAQLSDAELALYLAEKRRRDHSFVVPTVFA